MAEKRVAVVMGSDSDLPVVKAAVEVLKEFHVPESEYDILPFPINCPEYLLQYVPKDAVYYMGLCDEWDEEKYKILRSLGLKVEILWRKTPEEKGVTASWVRGRDAAGLPVSLPPAL